MASPVPDWTSEVARSQFSDDTLVGALTPSSVDPETPALTLVFLAGRRHRLAVSTKEEEEAEEEVDVMELGLVFLDLSPPAGLANDGRGAASLAEASGSEQGFRNGDLLSLSLQKTTAMESPTTEDPGGPAEPRRSRPGLPPVVLLTPSRTRTDTLDCNLPLRLLPSSFLDLPERLGSFLLLLSCSLFFLVFLLLFSEVRPERPGTDADPDVTFSEERCLVLDLLEDKDDVSYWSASFSFFFWWRRVAFGAVLTGGAGTSGSGGRPAGGVSSNNW